MGFETIEEDIGKGTRVELNRLTGEKRCNVSWGIKNICFCPLDSTEIKSSSPEPRDNKIPICLNNFKQLEILDISANIKKIENLDKLVNLKEITIKGYGYNSIEKIENLDNLVNLRRLFLDFNGITKIENLGKLKKLDQLDLSMNLIDTLESKDLLPNLDFLIINMNPLKEIGDMKSFPKLEYLNLNNQASKTNKNLRGLERLAKLKNLTSLGVDKVNLMPMLMFNAESSINTDDGKFSFKRLWMTAKGGLIRRGENISGNMLKGLMEEVARNGEIYKQA